MTSTISYSQLPQTSKTDYHPTDFVGAILLILLQIGVLIGWEARATLAMPDFLFITIGMVIGIIGVGLNLYDVTTREFAKKIIFVSGLVTFLYFSSFFAQNSLIADFSPVVGTGFWLGMLASAGLCLQYVIPRPETLTTSPISEMLQKSPFEFVFSLSTLVLVTLNLAQGVSFMRLNENKLTLGFVALAIGIFGIWLLFYFTNELVENLPEKIRDALRPFVFVGPALAILGVFLVYPAINTFILSFRDARGDFPCVRIVNDAGRSVCQTEIVDGETVEVKNYFYLGNYDYAFNNDAMRIAFRNNVMWLILVTGVSVSLGLVIAVLVDRIGRWESVAKSLIFLPMAISAVGASVIWGFMYFVQGKPNQPQIGLINAIIVGLGGERVNILNDTSINNLALITIMIWLITGYCMVILSAAVKGVPDELLEAARIDGAGEVRIFFNVIIPFIRGTLLVVITTVFTMVLKVFDIVYTLTGGRRETEVIANRMFSSFFREGNYGQGSAIAVVMLIALLPVVFWNIRNLRKQRA